MGSLFDDIRFWISSIATIIAILIAKIVRSYDKQIDELYNEIRDLKEEIHELKEDIENLHRVVTGHLQYHKGVENGKKKK